MQTETQLGDADEMFRLYFERWYDAGGQSLKWSEATRPDMIQIPEFVGRPPTEVGPLDEATATKVAQQIDAMVEAAKEDWPTYLKVQAPLSVSWVESFDAHYDINRVEELARRCDPTNFSNDYLVIVCEFGAVLGTVMKDLLPRLTWLPWWPYWESAIFDPQTGIVIPVFHWSIKKFSTYGVDDGFAAKLLQCVQMLKR